MLREKKWRRRRRAVKREVCGVTEKEECKFSSSRSRLFFLSFLSQAAHLLDRGRLFKFGSSDTRPVRVILKRKRERGWRGEL